jgi:hypothetical protein
MQFVSIIVFVRNTRMQVLEIPQCFCKILCDILRRLFLSLAGAGGGDMHVFVKVTHVFYLKNIGL